MYAVLIRTTPHALRLAITGLTTSPSSAEATRRAARATGLLLEALAAAGTAEVSLNRALVLLTLYVAAAASAAAFVSVRRGISA